MKIIIWMKTKLNAFAYGTQIGMRPLQLCKYKEVIVCMR